MKRGLIDSTALPRGWVREWGGLELQSLQTAQLWHLLEPKKPLKNPRVRKVGRDFTLSSPCPTSLLQHRVQDCVQMESEYLKRYSKKEILKIELGNTSRDVQKAKEGA